MNQEPLLSAFTRLRDNLLSMSRHILQNEDDASDAIQEAFCRLWPIRNKIKSEKEAAALTVTTTRNICIDQIRKKARFPELDIETNNECDEDNSEKENLLERFQTVKLLIEKRLTENQRKILELRDYQGLEIEDIANRLNMQPATIRMNLSRARKTIREQVISHKGIVTDKHSATVSTSHPESAPCDRLTPVISISRTNQAHRKINPEQ